MLKWCLRVSWCCCLNYPERKIVKIIQGRKASLCFLFLIENTGLFFNLLVREQFTLWLAINYCIDSIFIKLTSWSPPPPPVFPGIITLEFLISVLIVFLFFFFIFKQNLHKRMLCVCGGGEACFGSVYILEFSAHSGLFWFYIL